MKLLWVLCEHGEKGSHGFWPNDAKVWGDYTKCPGGREATREDVIEALGGEKIDLVVLAQTVARFNKTLDLAALDPDRASNETEWSAYEADVERLIEPAQLILDVLSVREAE